MSETEQGARVAQLGFIVNLDEFEPLTDMETALPIIHRIAFDVAHQVYDQVRQHVHKEWPDVGGMVPRGPINTAMVMCAVLDQKHGLTLEAHGATSHPLNPEGSYQAAFQSKDGKRIVGKGFDATTAFYDVLKQADATKGPRLVLAT